MLSAFSFSQLCKNSGRWKMGNLNVEVKCIYFCVNNTNIDILDYGVIQRCNKTLTEWKGVSSLKSRLVLLSAKAVLWARLFKLRQITMGWCWPSRCKLRSLSPQGREDRGVSREVFSPTGSTPGLAPGCSANSSFPLSDPLPPPPLPPLPPGCQSAWLVWAKQAPSIGPKGQRNSCQLGQHFTAEHHSPNKQCSGPQATGNMEPVITSRAWLVHSPKPKPGQGLECVLHLTLANFSARGCHKVRESHFRITLDR